MTWNATILGCGMIGATMARDLAADDRFAVTAVDVDPRNLHALRDVARLTARQADLSAAETVRTVIADAHVVVGAMPSRFGLATLRTVIEARKPYADISFMPEDALSLDELAKQHGITAVVDCGVAPGLANLMIGRSHALLARTDEVRFYVGGLPVARTWPYQYKAPFAPADVIEEYTRPARMRVGGRVVVRPALSDPELIDFPGVGTLEAFNTDGLRSLLKTIAAPDMCEKTLRYPGHIELMRVLRATGFFNKDMVQVGGVSVRPLDLTSKLLFPMWSASPKEREYTLLRVIVVGAGHGDSSPPPSARATVAEGSTPRRVRHVYDLYDETDAATGTSSMARTTGFPCAIVARLLASGELRQPGVNPPELLATVPGFYDHVVTELARRGVQVSFNNDVLTSP